MTTAKIEISVGAITFSGEGTENWLEKQLDKLLASAPQLAAISPPAEVSGNGGNGGGDAAPQDPGTLAAFIQKHGGGSNQVKRFLTTAEWLHRKGKSRIQTKDVTAALGAANQKRLGNAAECLNQNVSKGHCEKDGKQFYVTPEGRASL